MKTALASVRAYLPRGDTLDDEGFGQRHRLLSWLVALHLPAIVAFAAFQGTGALHGALEILPAAFVLLCVGQILFWRATETAQEKGKALAVDLARAESELSQRGAVSELFVHLARRNQSLLDRQISLLVELEHVERDPDGLAELFKLDHLATRIRRNAESLLVLSGEESPRRWGRPVALADVVRAAVAEVEDYTRGAIVIDENISLSGRAVADVAHLLAELLENALTFSPPDTRVMVRNHLTRGGDGSCLITIEDRGIGMPSLDMAGANEMLADPPDVGLKLSQQLGFHVVGRLGARYGIDVSLAPTPGGGVTALVRIPPRLLTDGDDDLGDDRRPALVGTASAPPAPVVPAAPTRPPDPMAMAMAGPGIAAAPLRAVPASAVGPAPMIDPTTLPVAARTAAVLAEPAPVDIPQLPSGPDSIVTDGGGLLPRRTPGLSLGSATPISFPALGSQPRAAAGRSPEEVRQMLSRFQSSQAAGRDVANGEHD